MLSGTRSLPLRRRRRVTARCDRRRASRRRSRACGSTSRRRSSARLSVEHVDARLAEHAERAAARVRGRRVARPVSAGMPRALATRAAWYSAAAMLMSGSRPLPDAVTRSTGTGGVLSGSASRSALIAILHRIGERRIARALVGAGRRRAVVGLRRGRRRPAPEVLRVVERLADERRAHVLPSASIRLPFAARGNATCAMPGDDERIDDAGQHGQHDQHPQRREELSRTWSFSDGQARLQRRRAACRSS